MYYIIPYKESYIIPYKILLTVLFKPHLGPFLKIFYKYFQNIFQIWLDCVSKNQPTTHCNPSECQKQLYEIKKTKIINERVNKSNFNPGQVVDMSKEKLFIQTGNGLISITRLQLEGKKSLDIKSFLNGYTLNIGDYFGK